MLTLDAERKYGEEADCKIQILSAMQGATFMNQRFDATVHNIPASDLGMGEPKQGDPDTSWRS